VTSCVIRTCRQEFVKRSMTHKACSPDCAAEYAKQQRQKAELKELRARKLAIKPRSAWLKEAQAAFNAYIRERDKAQPCICCGQPLTAEAVGGGYDCGHYRSIGSAPHLRFDERNAHGQRKVCNRWGAGRAVDYRIGLVARIGLAELEALEADNQARKYSVDDLKKIRDFYRAKLKVLKVGSE
jgi:hypothetical protein